MRKWNKTIGWINEKRIVPELISVAASSANKTDARIRCQQTTTIFEAAAAAAAAVSFNARIWPPKTFILHFTESQNARTPSAIYGMAIVLAALLLQFMAYLSGRRVIWNMAFVKRRFQNAFVTNFRNDILFSSWNAVADGLQHWRSRRRKNRCRFLYASWNQFNWKLSWSETLCIHRFRRERQKNWDQKNFNGARSAV